MGVVHIFIFSATLVELYLTIQLKVYSFILQSYKFLMSALEGYMIHLDQKDVSKGML